MNSGGQKKPAGSESSPSVVASDTPTGEATQRVKRQELSLAERIEVIRLRDQGKTMREIAMQFNCGKTQIMNIMSQRERYFREWQENEGQNNPFISARKRRSRRTGNEETNKIVWDWYQKQKSRGIRVTGPMLQKEAKAIANNLGIHNFAASNGWLDSFRKLHNIGPSFSKTLEKRAKKSAAKADASIPSSTSTSSSSREVITEASALGQDRFSPVAGPSHAGHFEFETPATYQPNVSSVEQVTTFPDPPTRNLSFVRDPLPAIPRVRNEPFHEYKHFANMAAMFQTAEPYPLGQAMDDPADEEPVPTAMPDPPPQVAQNMQPVIRYITSEGSQLQPVEPHIPRVHSFRDETGNFHLLGGSPGPPPVRLQRAFSVPEDTIRNLEMQRKPDAIDPIALCSSITGKPIIESTVIAAPQVSPVLEAQQLESCARDEAKFPHQFVELINLARAEGLVASFYRDEVGESWLELRQATASFRVPLHGYRTHLARLIVNVELRYWLEVVGHCVRWGSLSSGGNLLDRAQVIPVLCALSGEYVVCRGKGSVLKRASVFEPKLVIELGMAHDMHYTLPDYRYRSHDCRLWLPSSAGPWCNACRNKPGADEDVPVIGPDPEPPELLDQRGLGSRTPAAEPLDLSRDNGRALPRSDGSIILHSRFSSGTAEPKTTSPMTVIPRVLVDDFTSVRPPVDRRVIVSSAEMRGAVAAPAEPTRQTQRFHVQEGLQTDFEAVRTEQSNSPGNLPDFYG